jgi:hypothetical protein
LPKDEIALQRLNGLYLLEGVPVTVYAVATVAWEGSPGVAVSVSVRARERDRFGYVKERKQFR